MIYYSTMDTNGYSTWLEIDLGAIRNNVQQLLNISQCNVMAVVKANGYGHGIVQIAQAAIEAGANWCGVGRLEEGLMLRQAGIDCKILVLGYTPPTGILEAINQGISVTLYDEEQADQYAEQAGRLQKQLGVHLKLETGMGRLGILAVEAPKFFEKVLNCRSFNLEGIFTHFARADEPEVSLTRQQALLFDDLLDQIQIQNYPQILIHAANSAGALYFPGTHYNLVRSGIALYGLDPSPQAKLPASFQSALTWRARLTSTKLLPPGHGISYGSIYTTRHEERIGTIPVGYADGFRRADHQVVLLDGERIPVVGRVCMDQCAVQLDSHPNAHIGDEVVLLGRQGKERITAEEIGTRWGTVNYEVVCGLAHRLPRVYF